MATNENYLRRLWSLHDPAGQHRVTSPQDLLNVLRADFSGGQTLFSSEEYRDPLLRESIIEDITHPHRDPYAPPPEIVQFVHQLLGDGRVLSIYSGFGDFLFEFGSGIGIEPNPSAGDWANFFASTADLDASTLTADPMKHHTEEQWDRVVCAGPFAAPDDALLVALSVLSESGQLAALLPASALWGARSERTRQTVSKRWSIDAVISLPLNVFSRTTIPAAIVLIGHRTPGDQTYMAKSKTLSDLPAIAADYHAWRQSRPFSVGFHATLTSQRWDVEYNEPIDFEFGDLGHPYRIVPLGTISAIRPGAPSDAKIAINRTGSKTVWVPDEPDLNARNNIYLTPNDDISASYLYFYLRSGIGKRVLARFTKGISLPYLSPNDLKQLPVVLPELLYQTRIVSDALALMKTVGNLEALVIEGRQALHESLFALSDTKDKFDRFAEDTESAFYRKLPFPIAVVYRKISNAPNNTQRFSLLIELFEVVVRFLVLIYLAEYLNGRRQGPLVVDNIPDIRKLYAPVLGDWVSFLQAFVRMGATSDTKSFLAEMKDFELTKYQRVLQEFVTLRNASLRGHGSTLTEDEYERRFQEYSPKVFELIAHLGFLRNYSLVKTGSMEKDGDFYRIRTQMLMGDNPHFEASHIILRTPLDTNKVLYLNRNLESLMVDPYVVLDLCSECRRPEVLLFDKLSKDKITYIGYESGHKPSLPNAERIPSIIREVAVRGS